MILLVVTVKFSFSSLISYSIVSFVLEFNVISMLASAFVVRISDVLKIFKKKC